MVRNMAELTGESIVKMTGDELIDVWTLYLDSEIETHERDIQRNTGKVAELKELRDRMQGTCRRCGKFIYNYGKEDRMAEHMVKIMCMNSH